MPDYSKGKIYCIRSFKTDDIYIGSTTQTLAQRLGKHKGSYKYYLKNNKYYISSFEILKYDDYYIELIKLYPCSCREELVAEEGKFIRDWDCVNKRIDGRTRKQYSIDNRDKNRERCKKYRIDNIEKLKKYRIDIREKNIEKCKKYNKQKLRCICGTHSLLVNFRRHIKSKKHKNLMSEFIQNFISH